eukprot:TRINITY_DN11255_c0_g1_i1.p1 TRINITY_DN11255_c0_g1~~TRINITY_DN11255_c0_g1_i1.p1  ORF type:complete len:280 (-),score=93.67 TRINITY_DN11255_c0_g1_i1:76-894(-)
MAEKKIEPAEEKAAQQPSSQGKFESQSGGHADAFIKLEGEGKIMKTTSKKEIQFYRDLHSKYPHIEPFAPKFFGIEERNGKEYVKMEDLTVHFDKPNVMDVKLGTTSVGEDADEEKKKSMGEKDRNSTTATLGFRVTGLSVYNPTKKDYEKYGKSYGQKLTAGASTENAYVLFFSAYGKEAGVQVVNKFLEKLRELQKMVEGQKVCRIYSSSILFLYGREKGQADGKIVQEMRMIDFAHVHDIKDGGRDEGYITGINNLIQYFEKVVQQLKN